MDEKYNYVGRLNGSGDRKKLTCKYLYLTVFTED